MELDAGGRNRHAIGIHHAAGQGPPRPEDQGDALVPGFIVGQRRHVEAGGREALPPRLQVVVAVGRQAGKPEPSPGSGEHPGPAAVVAAAAEGLHARLGDDRGSLQRGAVCGLDAAGERQGRLDLEHDAGGALPVDGRARSGRPVTGSGGRDDGRLGTGEGQPESPFAVGLCDGGAVAVRPDHGARHRLLALPLAHGPGQGDRGAQAGFGGRTGRDLRVGRRRRAPGAVRGRQADHGALRQARGEAQNAVVPGGGHRHQPVPRDRREPRDPLADRRQTVRGPPGEGAGRRLSVRIDHAQGAAGGGGERDLRPCRGELGDRQPSRRHRLQPPVLTVGPCELRAAVLPRERHAGHRRMPRVAALGDPSSLRRDPQQNRRARHRLALRSHHPHGGRHPGHQVDRLQGRRVEERPDVALHRDVGVRPRDHRPEKPAGVRDDQAVAAVRAGEGPGGRLRVLSACEPQNTALRRRDRRIERHPGAGQGRAPLVRHLAGDLHRLGRGGAERSGYGP